MENKDQKEEVKINEQEVVENNEETSENLADSADEQNDNQVLKLQNEISEQKDKYLRLYSEFENFRRRTSKEKLEMIQSANERRVCSVISNCTGRPVFC